jgi:hypothetical protein
MIRAMRVIHRPFAAALAIALMFAAAGAIAAPNLEGFWTVRFERQRSGQALIDELPKTAVLINDTGAGELAAGDFAGLKLSPAALEQVRDYNYQDELKRENTCNAPTVAFFMQAPFPMEIYQGTKLIVFKMEYFDLTRVIFLDGRPHPPASAPHSRSGHSVGHWEGDTLVVDTTHISSGTFMNNGFNHSNALHLIEKFRVSDDGTTLWLTQLYEDPQVFAGLAARYMAWTRKPGDFVYPYDCDPSYGK